jgi:hypothetical protein
MTRGHHVASYPLFVPLAWGVSADHRGVRMDATRAADGCRSGDGRSAGAIVSVRHAYIRGRAGDRAGPQCVGDPAAAVVSLLGWMMTIKGAGLLLVPAAGWTALPGTMHYPSHSSVYTIFPAIVEAYLTYAAFVRKREQKAVSQSRAPKRRVALKVLILLSAIAAGRTRRACGRCLPHVPWPQHDVRSSTRSSHCPDRASAFRRRRTADWTCLNAASAHGDLGSAAHTVARCG